MKWIARLPAIVWSYLSGWVNPPYKTLTGEADLPKPRRRRTRDVVQEDGDEEQAARRWPGGCGKTLHMNWRTDERPGGRRTRH
ncbi:MAG: hypothetical protein AB7O43_21205, partial [Hyphomicrobiaceae bacterium]